MMELSQKTIERMCRLFGYLDARKESGAAYVSSKEIAQAIGASEYTVRKDISLLDMTGHTRKGYPVEEFKEALGKKLHLHTKRKACIVGLGRLSRALIDYEKFKEDGFEIVAGFDNNINKVERIRTNIKTYEVGMLKNVVREQTIELGIITVPGFAAQAIADILIDAGIKGILNFSPIKVVVPPHIIHADMDFTSTLRYIAARLEH